MTEHVADLMPEGKPSLQRGLGRPSLGQAGDLGVRA
jgi:hypothetical protein